MNIQNFAKLTKSPYVRIMTTWDQTEDKKKYGIRTKYKDFTIEKANAYDATIDFETNQILLKIPKSYIVIDTDDEDIYEKLTDFL